MAEVLGIAASITGLLAVAGQISTIIHGFISSAKNAPASARHAHTVVEEMRMILLSYERLEGELHRYPRNRREAIHCNHLVAIFTDMVESFSGLEALMGRLDAVDGDLSRWDVPKWLLLEDKISLFIQRLESHLNALSAILLILSVQSNSEAQWCLNTLNDTVQHLLEQNQEILRRMERLDSHVRAEDASVKFLDDESFLHRKAAITASQDAQPASAIQALKYQDFTQEFETVLEQSPVYRRAQSNECDISFTTSVVRSHAWTELSRLSLGNISTISIIALPITLEDIQSIGCNLTFADIVSGHEATRPKSTSKDRGLTLFRKNGPMRGPRIPLDRRPAQQPAFGFGRAVNRLRVDRELARNKEAIQPSHASHFMTLYKLVMLGDAGVDKTALTIRFTLGHYTETYDPTIEDSYRKQVTIDDQSCMLEVLDTAGQEEYVALRDQWIRDAEGFIIVYSIISRSSFIRTQKFHNQIQRVKKAAAAGAVMFPGSPLSQTTGPLNLSPPVMLVGHHCERTNERQVSLEEGEELAKHLRCQFVEASAKDCINVEKVFFDVVRMLRLQRKGMALATNHR